MATKKFGQLAPRYTFAINPFKETRFSKCPSCQRATYPRKFPLLIYIEEVGILILGKTCKYCSKCEFIIAHQDELESALTKMLMIQQPSAIGNEYFIFGTMDKRMWKKGLEQPRSTVDIRPHTADIKDYATLEYEPAQWVYRGDA